MYFKLTTEEFINRAKNIHDNRFDYSKTVYINQRSKITILCNEHGDQETLPDNHLKGEGCPRCSKEYRRISLSEFIDRAKEVHNNKYNYSKSEYKNARTKVKIICNIHGQFEQLASDHLSGKGCSKCKASKGEDKIREYFDLHNIEYEREKSFRDCINEKLLRFDFYLPKYNMCIEYDGRQHFQPEQFGSLSREDAEMNFKNQKNKDDIKTKYCANNKIELLRIPYWKFKKLAAVLEKRFK